MGSLDDVLTYSSQTITTLGGEDIVFLAGDSYSPARDRRLGDDAMVFRPLLHVGSGETGETRGTSAVLRSRSVDRDGERGQRFQLCWL